MLQGQESTFQQQKSDLNKIMKLAKEEWDQSDLRLGNYARNSHQKLLLKNYLTDMFSLGSDMSGICRIYPEKGVYVRSTQKLSSQY
jgi:hypothetical protein